MLSRFIKNHEFKYSETIGEILAGKDTNDQKYKAGLDKVVAPFKFSLGSIRSVDDIVNEPSGLLLIFTGERDKEGKVRKKEATPEERQARIRAALNEEFRQSYETLIDNYIGRFEATKTKGGQPKLRMSFQALWNPTYETNTSWESISDRYKVMVEYKFDKKVFGLFKRKEVRQKILTPEKLKEIADYRRTGKLYYVTFSPTEKGKLCALMNLSMVALQSKDLTLEEGKDLIRNLYFAIYITSEKLEPDIYDIFCRIERVPKGKFLQTDDSLAKEIARYSHDLRKAYGLDVNRGYGQPVRRSHDVETLIEKARSSTEK